MSNLTEHTEPLDLDLIQERTKPLFVVGDLVRVASSKGNGQVYVVERVSDDHLKVANENATLIYRKEAFGCA